MLFQEGSQVEIVGDFENGSRDLVHKKKYPKGSTGTVVGSEQGRRDIVILQMKIPPGAMHDGRIHVHETFCQGCKGMK